MTTHPPLTADELADLRRLCDAATPGPWYAHHTDDRYCMNVFCVTTSPVEPDTEYGSGRGIVAATLLQTAIHIAHESNRWEQNAEFIAAARTAVPRLLDEVERLREEVERMRQNAITVLGDIDEPPLADPVYSLCVMYSGLMAQREVHPG